MPQIMPMNWSMMLLMWNLILLMWMMLMYFIFLNKNFNNKKMMIPQNKINFKTNW